MVYIMAYHDNIIVYNIIVYNIIILYTISLKYRLTVSRVNSNYYLYFKSVFVNIKYRLLAW